MPKTIWGKKLPTSNNKNDKTKRIRIYLLESIIFTIAMTLFDIIALLLIHNRATFMFFDNYIVNYILSVFLTSLILFSISFIFDYLVSELTIKKYIKK